MMQNSKDTKWLIGSISLFPASPSSHRQPLPVSRDSLQRHSAQNVSMAVLKASLLLWTRDIWFRSSPPSWPRAGGEAYEMEPSFQPAIPPSFSAGLPHGNFYHV